MEIPLEDYCRLRERISISETKIEAADKALGVAKDSVSMAQIGTVVTIVLSVIAILVAWLKH